MKLASKDAVDISIQKGDIRILRWGFALRQKQLTEEEIKANVAQTNKRHTDLMAEVVPIDTTNGKVTGDAEIKSWPVCWGKDDGSIDYLPSHDNKEAVETIDEWCPYFVAASTSARLMKNSQAIKLCTSLEIALGGEVPENITELDGVEGYVETETEEYAKSAAKGGGTGKSYCTTFKKVYKDSLKKKGAAAAKPAAAKAAVAKPAAAAAKAAEPEVVEAAADEDAVNEKALELVKTTLIAAHKKQEETIALSAITNRAMLKVATIKDDALKAAVRAALKDMDTLRVLVEACDPATVDEEGTVTIGVQVAAE